MAHTERPWCYANSRIWSISHEIAQLKQRKTDGFPAAIIAARKEVEANGRLIETAPDLLFVLGGLTDALREGRTVTIEPESVLACRIITVVEAAEGGKR